MSAYYNEIDPHAAQWLRNLISAGHIAPGDVDTRSIEDVTPNDLKHYTQHHFFAGVGGWSLALRLAGWSDLRPVWTGSCPCQPFSGAGKGRGFADERHLWPAWYHLLRECRPGVVFGEQVASGDGLAWLDLVHADMEAAGYACGAVDFCAAGIGAPHIRQRLWFVAECMGNAVPQGLPLRESPELQGARGRQKRGAAEQPGGAPLSGCWAGADWLDCTDNKTRPVEPGAFPLAPRLPNHVGRLRAYGNSIVPQVAAEVIRAHMNGATNDSN